jgi:sugar transferase (PEP-CTERM/EpsH1 system associated)
MTPQTKSHAICHVIHSFSHIGGAENGIINIVNKLVDQSVLHVICALTNIGDIRKRVKSDNVIFHELNKREGNDIRVPFKLAKIFMKEKISVVHLRGWATMAEGILGARMAGVNKVIYSEHGRHFDDVWQHKKLKYTIKRFLFSRVDSVMAVSRELGREITELYRLCRPVEVVTNGVDLSRFCPKERGELRARLGWGEEEKVVGVVGRLCEGKGIERMVGEFLDTRLSARLVIVGDGPLRECVESILCKHDYKSNVSLLGPRDDVAELLNCFNVLALPSASEGMSNVLLEGMASGVSVVAFRVGGNHELIDSGQGGFLVEHDDWKGFFSSIRCLIDDPCLADKMGIYNRHKTVNQFSLEQMISNYKKLYGISG